MRLAIGHDDTRIMGRSQQLLNDSAWWRQVAQNRATDVRVTTRGDGSFDHVLIDLPDQSDIDTVDHVLRHLDSSY